MIFDQSKLTSMLNEVNTESMAIIDYLISCDKEFTYVKGSEFQISIYGDGIVYSVDSVQCNKAVFVLAFDHVRRNPFDMLPDEILFDFQAWHYAMFDCGVVKPD